VKEVWYWRKGRIQVHVLRGESYAPVPASEALRGIDLDELAGFIDRPTTGQAMRDYQEALRAR